MKNKKITRKISQGMYVLTTKNGGCIVDAVGQQRTQAGNGGSNPGFCQSFSNIAPY